MPSSCSIRWAGVLPEEQLFGWSLEPMVRIAHGLRARHPKVPIIAFPRAVGPAALMYRRPDAFTALSIDTGIGAHWAAKELQPHICLQGNLDPIMLVTGGPALEREATRILDKLGHGLVRLQSRPRRGAADAAGTCRAAGRDRAQLEAVGVMSAITSSPLPRLRGRCQRRTEGDGTRFCARPLRRGYRATSP